MVTPMSESERNSGNLKLKLLFVVLVSSSAGLVALQADASIEQLLVAIGGGFVVSIVLLWYLIRTLEEFRPDGAR